MGANNAKEINHDPGPEGASGEGTTVLVIIFGLYLITLVMMYRKRYGSKAASPPPDDPGVEMAESGGKPAKEEDKAEEKDAGDEVDKKTLELWTQPAPYEVSPEFRAKFIRYASCGLVTQDDGSAAFRFFDFLAGVDWAWCALILWVFFLIFCFLLALSMMGTGFKLLGGKDSAKMFDVVDNPISGLMVGILATVLVQSSSTSTSIIISLVGADELSVSNAVPMVMGANIGTSVTNTIVALGHFADPAALRRGFAAATVHDCFNILSVLVLLPLNWATGFLQKMTYEMAKEQEACDEDAGENCNKQEFVKPYLSPYVKGVAVYDKKVAKYVAQAYCEGKCESHPDHDTIEAVTAALCPPLEGEAGGFDCTALPGYRPSWMADDGLLKYTRLPQYLALPAEEGALAEYLYACPEGAACEGLALFNASSSAAGGAAGALLGVCESFKTGLCDKRLLKGGIMLENWQMTDEGAGALCTVFSLSMLCCCLFLIIVALQTIVKGAFARALQKALSVSGYFSMLIGMGITILVQSSSITTSTLTPLAAVGVITLEQTYPITLGANIGTTLTGIMAATVVTSNAVAGWQVALCHLFFNIFGIMLWYPVPRAREVPLNMARWLGKMTASYGTVFPIVYTGVAFFLLPGLCYGIAKAANP